MSYKILTISDTKNKKQINKIEIIPQFIELESPLSNFSANLIPSSVFKSKEHTKGLKPKV